MGLAGPGINWSYITPRLPNRRETTNRTRNITNRSLAIPAANPAMPPNPNTAATSATIRKKIDQDNILISPLVTDTLHLFSGYQSPRQSGVIFDALFIVPDKPKFNQGYSYRTPGNPGKRGRGNPYIS